MTWVGPETVTTLIEAHGVEPASMLRPGWQGEAGWPVLLPLSALDHLRAVSPERMPPDVIEEVAGHVPTRVVDVGDPGVQYDAETPLADLPPYEGPPGPPAGHTHEWGDAVAERGVDEDIPARVVGSRRSRRPPTTPRSSSTERPRLPRQGRQVTKASGRTSGTK